MGRAITREGLYGQLVRTRLVAWRKRERTATRELGPVRRGAKRVKSVMFRRGRRFDVTGFPSASTFWTDLLLA